MIQKLENDVILYWLEEGILFSKFKTKTNIDIKNIKTLIELRHQISANKKQYWCIDMSNVNHYEKNARDYAEINGQDFLFATAVIINSHVARFIMNTFLLLKKPVIPFQAFKNKEDAVRWLSELKRKNETA